MRGRKSLNNSELNSSTPAKRGNQNHKQCGREKCENSQISFMQLKVLTIQHRKTCWEMRENKNAIVLMFIYCLRCINASLTVVGIKTLFPPIYVILTTLSGADHLADGASLALVKLLCNFQATILDFIAIYGVKILKEPPIIPHNFFFG